MRRTLALLAAVGIALVSSLTAVTAANAGGNGTQPARGHFKHLVVVYEENHSFDNLYGGWGAVNGQAVDGIGGPGYATHGTQVDQNGDPIGCLFQNDANLGTVNQHYYWIGEPTSSAPTHPGHQSVACSDTLPNGGAAFDSHFTASTPFPISSYVGSTDTSCAPPTASDPANGVLARSIDATNGDPRGLPGGCTRDIVHRFYQEQFQIDGGKQDRYPTGSDAAGLTQGFYDTQSLPIYTYLHSAGAPNYVVADHFFQSAFGGSFLNHQYLIAARAPVWSSAPSTKHSVLDSAGFPNGSYPLYAPQSGISYNDGPVTQTCPASPSTDSAGDTVDANGRACGNYAVNTMQPTNRPSGFGSNTLPLINDTDPTASNYETNIGDELSAHNVSWGYFAGGWDNASGNTTGSGWTNGTGTSCSDANVSHSATYPYCNDALFQFHHQPFNYFANYATGMPGRSHLQDETNFLAAAHQGTLPSVSFVKPLGEENEHPGYASTDNGESHLVDLVKAVESGPDAKDTLIVVTYDEFGGQWDHVAPPGQGNSDGPHDAYGPGTRIPALLIGAPVHASGVDSTSYDTTSILATIEQEWKLPPLASRDAQVNSLVDALTADDAGTGSTAAN